MAFPPMVSYDQQTIMYSATSNQEPTPSSQVAKKSDTNGISIDFDGNYSNSIVSDNGASTVFIEGSTKSYDHKK